MVEGTILPDLQRRAGITSVIASRTLRTWGESESGLAEMLAPRIDELDQGGAATLAFLASGMEGLKVRITAKAATEAEVQQVLDDESACCVSCWGRSCSVSTTTRWSRSCSACSSSGASPSGWPSRSPAAMIGSRLCDVPGPRGCSAQRRVLLDRGEAVAARRAQGPVVTESAAISMAIGARRVLGADVAVAATGVAGPDPAEGLAPGTVCLAVVLGDPDAGGVVDSMQVQLPGRRRQVREFTVITLLGLLRRRLLDQDGA